MHIHTIDENFEHQMKKIIKAMREEDPELQNLNAEQLQDAFWNKHAEYFGRKVLEACIDYSGDELFEKER